MKGGYFTDDGMPVDPEAIEIPALCNKCNKNGRQDEEMLCNLNRIDQRKEIAQGKEFICESFDQH